METYLVPDLQYHAQEDQYWCAPAVAMMILQHFKVPLQKYLQTDLHAEIDPQDGGSVRSLPSTLASAINKRLSSLPQTPTYREIPRNNAEEVARDIVFCSMQKRPCAVPIWDQAHWTVIGGVKTDVEPTKTSSYSVTWVLILIPRRWTGGDPPPPHEDLDNCRGIAGVSWHHAWDWKEVVEMPDHFPYAGVLPFKAEDIDLPIPTISPPKVPFHAKFLRSLGLKRIAAKRVGLDTELVYKIAQSAKPVGKLWADDPLRVHWLGDSTLDYDLVPIRDERGIVAFARVDAAEGWLRSIGILGAERSNFMPSSMDLVRTLVESPQMPSQSQGWWTGQVKRSRVVFKPSLESPLPYLPLIEVPLAGADSDKREVYVSFDLEVFTSLRTNGVKKDR